VATYARDALRTAGRHFSRSAVFAANYHYRRCLDNPPSSQIIALFDPFKHLPHLDIRRRSVHLNGTRVTTEDPKMTGFPRTAAPMKSMPLRHSDILDTNSADLIGVKARSLWVTIQQQG